MVDNDLKISKIDTFKAVHKIVGDGHVMTIADKTNNILRIELTLFHHLLQMVFRKKCSGQ